jgi:hypothetical protein
MPSDRFGGSKAWLRAAAMGELLRYDLLFALRGMRGLRARHNAIEGVSDASCAAAVCEAVRSVVPFYYKPVRCLQRSVVTARLLRQHGIRAEVVIGYRAVPFFSHAWVEVAGCVIDDSPSYQQRLQVLERL